MLNNLANVLAETGRREEARARYQQALEIDPACNEARINLAALETVLGHDAEAIRHYRLALKAKPDQPDALNNLAWILAADDDPALRNGREAVELAERAVKLTNGALPLPVGTLAAAYAEAGRFADAIQTASRARALAEERGQLEVVRRNEELLERYRKGQPARQGSLAGS